MKNTTLTPEETFFSFKALDQLYLFDPMDLKIIHLPLEMIQPSKEEKVNRLSNNDSFFLNHSDIEPQYLKKIKQIRNKLNANIGDPAPKKGLHVIVVTTENCNLDCVYCFREDHRKKTLLSEKTSEDLVSQLLRLEKENKIPDNKLKIVFFGGEPLLNINQLKLITELLEKNLIRTNVTFSISTNGTLLTKETSDYLKKHNFSIQVSVDGVKSTQDIQRPFKNGTGSYDKIYNNLTKNFEIKKYDKTVSARITVTNNDPIILEKVKHFHNMGFNRIAIGFTFVSANEVFKITDEFIEVIKQEYRKTIHYFSDVLASGKFINISPVVENLIALYLRSTKTTCHPGQSVIAISDTGEIFPCQRFVGISGYELGSTSEGWIDQNILKSITNQAKTCAFHAACKTCWVKNVCEGDCYYLRDLDEVNEDNPISCLVAIAMLEETIKAYPQLLDQNPEIFSKILK